MLSPRTWIWNKHRLSLFFWIVRKQKCHRFLFPPYAQALPLKILYSLYYAFPSVFHGHPVPFSQCSCAYPPAFIQAFTCSLGGRAPNPVHYSFLRSLVRFSVRPTRVPSCVPWPVSSCTYNFFRVPCFPHGNRALPVHSSVFPCI